MLTATAALTAFAMLDGEPPLPGLPLLVGADLAAALPVTLRARLPLTGALLSAAISLAGLVIPGWQGRLVTMVMFGAAAFRLPRRTWVVMGLSIAWTTGYGLLLPQAHGGLSVVTDLVIMGVAPVAVGQALRLHGERSAQAARLDHAEAGRAMAEERAALARDVHDSVGHHLTAIHMQATSTRRALRTRTQTTDQAPHGQEHATDQASHGQARATGPTLRGQSQAAERALGVIAELSSTALKEVRGMLDALREAPVGLDLDEIESLARRLSTPQLRISVHRATPCPPLPSDVRHTVFRVVQEALTNAARHSDAGHVEVRVRCDHTAVTLSITDDGHPRAGAEGRGIRGMRERVHQHGGTLTAGPKEGHGWRVEAIVPIAPGPQTSPEGEPSPAWRTTPHEAPSPQTARRRRSRR
ncbi:sensor histidine kinase [Sphaerisporangium krabiense]|uniref:histidine kinase n=1 Tax=Sphaerisporangium krabiense TaxID=763782 RepID=A0A7W9DNT0_9ACTN|nr:sensor histidine kinase [Sphaerisporangium krabiense]MBB5625746.1 signal transduction histidine kinase [Sphaerisporangium krabiense]